MVTLFGEVPSMPPSSYAIDDLLDGRPGALVDTAMLTAGRVLLIAPGLYLAGSRDILRTSVYVSASITLGMLLVRSWERRRT